jgi:acyl dehydratase
VSGAAVPVELSTAQIAEGGAHDLGTSRWLTVDRERIERFAGAGTTTAEGMLLLALVPPLVGELLVVPDATSKVNYGIERVRFLAPVPAGGRVRLNARLHGGERRAGGVLYRLDVHLELAGGSRPALVGTLLSVAQAAGEPRCAG